MMYLSFGGLLNDGLMDLLITVIWLFLGYKCLDYILAFPRRQSPTKNTKSVLVTGCDSGFGNLFAKRLDAKGFHVFAACLTEQGKDELQKSSTHIQAFVMDISKEESVKKGFDFVKQRVGSDKGLWAIVNNAGIVGPTGVADWLQIQDYRDVLDVNLLGTVSVVHTFLPLVKKTKGRIVNTASIVGRLAIPGSAPYVISKYAVEAYSDILRRELLPFKVSVHIVEPGFFKTRLSQPDRVTSVTRQVWDRLPPNIKEEYGEQYLIKSGELTTRTLPLMTSSRLDHVVSAYEHAVLSYFPRARYMPGWDARLLYWPLSLLPEWISDLVLTCLLPTPAAVMKKH